MDPLFLVQRFERTGVCECGMHNRKYYLRSLGSPYPSYETSLSLSIESRLRIFFATTPSNTGKLYEYFVFTKLKVK